MESIFFNEWTWTRHCSEFPALSEHVNRPKLNELTWNEGWRNITRISRNNDFFIDVFTDAPLSKRNRLIFCYLTPCDYFIWSYLKWIPRITQNLKNNTRHQIEPMSFSGKSSQKYVKSLWCLFFFESERYFVDRVYWKRLSECYTAQLERYKKEI